MEDSREPDSAEDSCPSLTDDSGSDSGDPELMQPREEELNAAQDECEERIEEESSQKIKRNYASSFSLHKRSGFVKNYDQHPQNYSKDYKRDFQRTVSLIQLRGL